MDGSPHSKSSSGFVRMNLKDVVADRLRELLFAGHLRPGNRIDQDEIAADVQVSKLPVREALILLESEGLVVNVPRRGSFVAALTPDDIRDHYRIYALVSGIAAERAAVRLGAPELEEIREMLDQFEAAKDPRVQEELNDRFHSALNRVGGTRRLTSALRNLSRTMPSRFFEFATGWADVAAKEHRRIFEALLDQDSQEVREAMVAHVVSGGEYAIQMLERRGFFDRDEDD